MDFSILVSTNEGRNGKYRPFFHVSNTRSLLHSFVAAFVRVSCYVAVSRGSGQRLVMVASSWIQRRKEYIDHRLITKVRTVRAL